MMELARRWAFGGLPTLSSVILAAAISGSAGSALAEIDVCTSSCDGNECVFREMLNLPLGQGELSITDECNLLIDNIGPSSQDGVVQPEIDSVYMKSTLATPNLSLSGQSALVEIRQVGIVDGQPGGEIMLTRIFNIDGNRLGHSVNCTALSVTGYEIYIYNGTQLVAQVEHGTNPPILVYPKSDLNSIACGIYPDSDVYTVFRLGAPVPIEVFTSATDPGPFVGDMVFVKAVGPNVTPTLQTDIESRFFLTGPVLMTSMERADTLPGQGDSCTGVCTDDDTDQLLDFLRAGLRGLRICAQTGEPVCPAPCTEFPTLEESGLSPGCYNLASCNLDALALEAAPLSWGLDRCAEAPSNLCDDVRRGVAGMHLVRSVRRISDGRESRRRSLLGGWACHRWIKKLGGRSCSSDICNEVRGWANEITGVTPKDHDHRRRGMRRWGRALLHKSRIGNSSATSQIFVRHPPGRVPAFRHPSSD